MPNFKVETIVEVRRTYFVNADTSTAAAAKVDQGEDVFAAFEQEIGERASAADEISNDDIAAAMVAA